VEREDDNNVQQGPFGKEPVTCNCLKAAGQKKKQILPPALMSSTHTILTIPAPGTSIKPVYEYTQEQKDQMVGLRQASSPSISILM
jgi:hypothetical protein